MFRATILFIIISCLRIVILFHVFLPDMNNFQELESESESDNR